MKALFSLAGGLSPKLSLDGYAYTLFSPESMKINSGRNLIETGVIIELPKKLKACIYPITEHAFSGLHKHDADVLPIVVSNGEIIVPIYNHGEPFLLTKGKEIAMLLLNRAYRLEKDKMAFSVNDTLVINKANCDSIKTSKRDTHTLYTVDFTFRKRKRDIIFLVKNEEPASFKVVEVKKNSYVIDNGLGLFPEFRRTVLEHIAIRKD